MGHEIIGQIAGAGRPSAARAQTEFAAIGDDRRLRRATPRHLHNAIGGVIIRQAEGEDVLPIRGGGELTVELDLLIGGRRGAGDDQFAALDGGVGDRECRRRPVDGPGGQEEPHRSGSDSQQRRSTRHGKLSTLRKDSIRKLYTTQNNSQTNIQLKIGSQKPK